MKIIIEEIKNIIETEIVVRCQENNEEVGKIVASLRLFDQTIIGKKDANKHILTLGEIGYFEGVDDKVFCYTDKDVYETSYRLYEVEEAFRSAGFVRVNKNTVLNANLIKSFKSSLNGRMEAMLDNGDRIEVSRSYVIPLKSLLGGKK